MVHALMLLGAGAAPTARAAPALQDSLPPVTASSAPETPVADPPPEEPKDAGELRIQGRVMALAELESRRRSIVGDDASIASERVSSLDLSLLSARLGIEYRAPIRWISAVAEVELAGSVRPRDVYVHAGKRWFARAGQFKMPSSAFELESAWTLPLVRRGFVHDLLTDWLDVAGRRPGILVGWRGQGGVKPRLSAGAFQGSVQRELGPGERDTELIERSSLEAQSYAARAQIEVADIDVAAWYEHRVGSPETGETSHYFTAGADAVLDWTFANGGVRVWLDGTLGGSWYVHPNKSDRASDATFLAGRLLAAYRFGGVEPERPYVEPYGFVAVFDPDLEVVADRAFEAAVGVNAGFFERARLALQAEVNEAERNFPDQYLGGEPPDRFGMLLMAGVAF